MAFLYIIVIPCKEMGLFGRYIIDSDAESCKRIQITKKYPPKCKEMLKFESDMANICQKESLKDTWIISRRKYKGHEKVMNSQMYFYLLTKQQI